jgi:hypothetical protein
LVELRRGLSARAELQLESKQISPGFSGPSKTEDHGVTIAPKMEHSVFSFILCPARG